MGNRTMERDLLILMVIIAAIGISSGANLPTDPNAPATPPCGDEVYDFEARAPTDLYSAGPILDPGWYWIWCGQRGNAIGAPDKWVAYGPAELKGGEFYVFDVAGDLGSPDPKMINPMLSKPLPSMALLWYKASTESAYGVCIEGPYDTKADAQNRSIKLQPCSKGPWGIEPKVTLAGPFLIPGSYVISYSKFLFSPDPSKNGPVEWKSYGPVELKDGIFYMLTLGEGVSLQPENPFTYIKRSLVSGETLVWMENVADYPIVFCIQPVGLLVTKIPSTTNATVGRTVTYTYSVNNNFNFTLYNLSLNDTRLGPIALRKRTLVPGERIEAQKSYTIVQADFPDPSSTMQLQKRRTKREINSRHMRAQPWHSAIKPQAVSISPSVPIIKPPKSEIK